MASSPSRRNFIRKTAALTGSAFAAAGAARAAPLPVPSTNREPGRIILRTKLNPPWAEIQVEDNGIGMSESVRKRTFEPFFTTKEIGQGTGLGLSVSYFIITNNHKGQMEVQSTLGQGTCFTLRLPLAGTPLVSQELNQLSR